MEAGPAVEKHCSRVLCCVVAQRLPDISKDHRAFICTVKEFKKFSAILLLKKEIKKMESHPRIFDVPEGTKKTQHLPGILTHKDKLRHSFL